MSSFFFSTICFIFPPGYEGNVALEYELRAMVQKWLSNNVLKHASYGMNLLDRG